MAEELLEDPTRMEVGLHGTEAVSLQVPNEGGYDPLGRERRFGLTDEVEDDGPILTVGDGQAHAVTARLRPVSGIDEGE